MQPLEARILNRYGQNRTDAIFTMIDCGSMGGVEREWQSLRDYIRFVGFEPDEREFNKLKNTKNEQYFNNLLFSDSEDLTFHITLDPGKSSIFRPNETVIMQFPNAQRFDVIKEVKVEANMV